MDAQGSASSTTLCHNAIMPFSSMNVKSAMMRAQCELSSKRNAESVHAGVSSATGWLHL